MADNGVPKGSIADTPYAESIPLGDLAQRIQGQVGDVRPILTDPGFQPPSDPLDQKPQVRIVYRDIPNVQTIQNNWTVAGVRGSLSSHMIGIFERSGQLADSILGDDRVQATLGSRISGLFGREVIFRPANDSAAAKECMDAWSDHWMDFFNSSVVELHAYAILMGFSCSQIVWDTTGDIWKPYLRPWHPRFMYYHWPLRRYIAISQDGQIAVVAGNAKWVLHAPYGEYRGWIRGAIRAVAEPWLIRHFAIRDWARYSEIHGIPVRVAEVPAASSEQDRDNFQTALAALGTETTIMVPQGVDKDMGFKLSLVEAKDHAWESFPGLRDHCDMAIVLSLLFQNLTTEVKGGSFAAATAHMDIRQSGIQDDDGAWKRTLRQQVARPFAFLNFGDAELAPYTRWDVPPREEYQHNADQFQKFGTAIEVLRRGGVQFNDPKAMQAFAAEKFGLKGLPDFTITEPVAGGGSGGGGGGFGK